MFGNILSTLGATTAEDNDVTTRRRYERRSTDRCISMINGKNHPVINWSQGGVLVTGDTRMFGKDDEVDITMKFKLQDKIIDVPHKARVVRKSMDKVALEFKPLTRQVRNKFQTIIEEYVTSDFAESHASAY